MFKSDGQIQSSLGDYSNDEHYILTSDKSVAEISMRKITKRGKPNSTLKIQNTLLIGDDGAWLDMTEEI